MSKFPPKFHLALLATLLGLGALSGCAATSANNTNDPSQDLSRLKSGPSPSDIEAMKNATKGNNSGPPQAAQNTASGAPQAAQNTAKAP